jgi:hypothetical protein
MALASFAVLVIILLIVLQEGINRTRLTAPPLFTLQFGGTVAAFVPRFVVVFSVLARWNELFKLSFSKKRLNLQQKYLIRVNNNNNDKK